MTKQEVIDVLQIIKRKELRDNEKTNKLCTNPSDSIGAKVIDEAIKFIEVLESEIKRADDAEKAAIIIYERFRNKCGGCRTYHDGNCKHNHNWDACNKHSFKVTLRQVEEDARLLDELDADRDHYKEMFDAVLRRGVTIERAVVEHKPCWACKHEKTCEGKITNVSCTLGFEYDVPRFAVKGDLDENTRP